MQHTEDNFKEYLKSLVVWGLPGLYVAILLYIATWLMSNIRVY